MMADVCDIAVALMMNDRLIGAARLQVVIADEPHVLGFNLARSRVHEGRIRGRDLTRNQRRRAG